MAAGQQQKKRLISSGVTRFNSLDHQHGDVQKKKKSKCQLPDDVWNLRPHVALEWDGTRNSAVARKDQVGITWMDLSPFLDDHPVRPKSCLADVLSVPEAIFGLEDLSEVFSYQAWERCLSESERKFLTRFLPEGTDADDTVRALLEGDNLHFGNPLKKWSSSLCSGQQHPDHILSRKKNIKDMKKSSYFYLSKYHNQFIDTVLHWKERWTSCKNPEKEIVEKLWRKGATTTSSSSLGVSERVNPINTSRKRMASESCFSFEDDTKYMSYFKVSKRQHQLIRKEKHSDGGILSTTLNHVLGDIEMEDLNLQPYAKFEEEERMNHHRHWLKLAYKDLPIAYERFREQGVLSRRWRNNIAQELSELEDVKNHHSANDRDDESDIVLEFSTMEQDNDEQYFSDEDSHQNGSSHNPCNEKCHLERIPSLNTRNEFEVVDRGGNQDNTAIMVDSPMDHLQSDGETKDIMNLSFNGNNESAPCHLPEVMHQNDINSNLLIEGGLDGVPSINTHQEVEIADMNQNMNQESAVTPLSSPLDRPKFVEMPNLVKSNSILETPMTHTIPLERLPSLNSHQDLNLINEESKDIAYMESRPPIGPLLFGNIKDATDLLNTEGPGCSARETWTKESITSSYCESASQRSQIYHSTDDFTHKQPQTPPQVINMETANTFVGHTSESMASLAASQRRHMYNSNNDLSHKQPQVAPQIIDVETNTLVGHTSESMPSLTAENGSPYFGQYANQQHSMLLPTFPKEQAMLTAYSNEHLDSLKRSELPFLARTGCLPQPSSSSHHFQGREMMHDINRARDNGHFLHLMANNSRYPNLNHAPLGSQDWLSHTCTNGGLTGQDMHPTEFRGHSSWSGVGPSGNMIHCLGNERSTDGSFYGVLPEYNESVPSYPSSNNVSHLGHASSYIGDEIYSNGNMPSNRFSYGTIPGQLSNLNSREATANAASLKAGGPWMSYSHQHHGINDLFGKSSLKTWNQ